VNSDSLWIQFREVQGAGVGVRSVLDRGVRSAIDIWGPLGVEAEVCFAGVGSLILLDAAYSPRLETPLSSYFRDGKTCAYIDRAGTVALMPGEPTHIIPPTATPPAGLGPGAASAAAATAIPSVPLTNCEVWPRYILNFRESPNGPIKGWVNEAVDALARTTDWFQVVLRGEIGWISAHYVTTVGDCG
ncbi:MAG: SH3 domain-containing protein, partial [Chloroflexi bacterium]|nr:SH3 domain-containing protein [Chloroflexota bacterium]